MYTKSKNKGFTLVELIVVIALIGILSLMSVPYLVGYTQRAKVQACNFNCLQLEKMYHTHLTMKGGAHIESKFNEYLDEYGQDICPDYGVIRYENGKVKCGIHPNDNDEEEGNSPETPFI